MIRRWGGESRGKPSQLSCVFACFSFNQVQLPIRCFQIKKYSTGATIVVGIAEMTTEEFKQTSPSFLTTNTLGATHKNVSHNTVPISTDKLWAKVNKNTLLCLPPSLHCKYCRSAQGSWSTFPLLSLSQPGQVWRSSTTALSQPFPYVCGNLPGLQ